MSARDDSRDRELLARVVERDSGALRELFQRYHARIFAFVQARLQDAPLAEEAAGDVFLEVWRSAGSFQGASRVSTWIFGIATFKAREADRSRRRMKRALVVPTNLETLHRVPDSTDADARIEARDELRWFGVLLRALPPAQREVLELALGSGFDTQQIADQLGVAPGTVKSRLSRARAEMRAAMRDSNRREA